MARNATEIQEDLDAAIASRRAAMQAQSYSMDSGQGRQQVTRVDLKTLNATIRELQNELETANADANGYGGLDHVDFQRNGC